MGLIFAVFFLCLTTLFFYSESRIARLDDSFNIMSTDTHHWADAAFDFISNMSCKDTFLTSEEDCNKIASIRKAVIPDGPLTRSDVHDSILVIDPYPEANLGHLLIVFYVDLGWTELQCQVNGGRYTDDGACLSLALRKKCHNLLLNNNWKLNYHRKKQCEINFFPLVHLDSEEPSQRLQKLECRDFVSSFAPCPVLRPRNHTDNLFCDALEENTLRCSTSSTTVGIRCRLFERCDHAVLISGGWDRLTDRPLYLENIVKFHDLLMKNGFLHSNVKMFYSNGNQGIEEHLGIKDEVFPAAFKLTMRYHIRKLCQSLHCADSLVIYMNSPTRNDGATLLWDINRNGQADDNELYTIKEFLQDTQDCMAQQVYVIADQNYAGKIIHALEHSPRHQNIIAFASGQEHEYSWNGDFTAQWTAFNSNQDCVGETHEAVKSVMNSSEPISFDGFQGAHNATIFGAPCNVLPPYTEMELRKKYYGCQFLPTSVWLRKTPFRPQEDESDDDDE
ncbi:hypothetical protein CDAR_251611 [Caerostris darwini]|uniref:Uncharacterized protein n=1 Tax=Caerostris darwini TaxID=1538125 RepID=A0AAV4RBZ5_9ARAC|nr:hypothetical protein CDAR_251611 [Caerostris darwini]